MPVSPAPEVSRNRFAGERRKPMSPVWRLRFWQMLIISGLVLIAGRLYYLQVIKGPQLTQQAAVQRQQSNLLIHRGAITDRHGLPLAIDTTRYDVYVHPSLLKVGTEEAAQAFARICHLDYKKISRLLNAGYPVVTVARHMGREEIDELQSLNWTGIDIVPRSFRHYPEGNLASHMLGYVNMDTHGQGGVEQAEESLLQNTGNLKRPQLDGRGRPIIVGNTTPVLDITPPMGRHVELTIDNYLQHLAEKELSAICIHSMAQRGCAIVLDPTNGEILAWANYPNYDPNEYHKYQYEITKNWAMVDVYQPGSTFKILTVASALDLGVIKPNTRFIDNGSITIGNRTLHNHEPGGLGSLDILHLFIHSSNVASAQIGLMMTPLQFHSKLSEFGLGHTTGIELPGESAGLLLNHKYWKPIDQATTGFGQGAIAMTPLQLAAAVSAVANNGTKVQPHLIRRIYDPRTGVTEKWTEPSKTQVLKPETAKLIAKLLGDNVFIGTQLAGKVPGYRVGGKTGTAQKVTANGRGYIAGATIASFVGFLPADNPQLLCLVVVDSPQTDGRWGNTIAGPVFNAICVEAARYLGIPPSEKIELNSKKAGANSFVPPSVKYAAEIQGKVH
ncbi:MAG: penicillin-binding protein 2 [Candidatus Obscuribacterales bacterium]|nr:penicillin-binding protein 2 [Candidatus Obscuribacterales bacterium]